MRIGSGGGPLVEQWAPSGSPQSGRGGSCALLPRAPPPGLPALTPLRRLFDKLSVRPARGPVRLSGSSLPPVSRSRLRNAAERRAEAPDVPRPPCVHVGSLNSEPPPQAVPPRPQILQQAGARAQTSRRTDASRRCPGSERFLTRSFGRGLRSGQSHPRSPGSCSASRQHGPQELQSAAAVPPLTRLQPPGFLAFSPVAKPLLYPECRRTPRQARQEVMQRWERRRLGQSQRADPSRVVVPHPRRSRQCPTRRRPLQSRRRRRSDSVLLPTPRPPGGVTTGPSREDAAATAGRSAWVSEPPCNQSERLTLLPVAKGLLREGKRDATPEQRGGGIHAREEAGAKAAHPGTGADAGTPDACAQAVGSGLATCTDASAPGKAPQARRGDFLGAAARRTR